MNGEGALARQPDEIFRLPLAEYMEAREEKCKEAARILGLYTVNQDLVPMIQGFWYAEYYRFKLKELGHV